MFDWNDLRYFLAVARTGSTVAAAKAMSVSQSTVQRRLVALEGSLDRKLFERHPAGYRLTSLGEQLKSHAEQVEEAVAAFHRHLASLDRDLEGTIRVTCPEGLVDALVSPLVKGFQARYPRMRIDLLVAERFLDLAKGEAEIAIRAGVLTDPMLICRKISDNPWAVYASLSYVERFGRPASPQDINRHTIVDFGDDIRRIPFAAWLRSVAPKATVAARSNTVIGLVMAAKSGVGLAILPVQLGDREERLVRVIDSVPELMSQIYLLVHPTLQRAPRIRAFIDFVFEEVANFRPLLQGQMPQAAGD